MANSIDGGARQSIYTYPLIRLISLFIRDNHRTISPFGANRDRVDGPATCVGTSHLRRCEMTPNHREANVTRWIDGSVGRPMKARVE